MITWFFVVQPGMNTFLPSHIVEDKVIAIFSPLHRFEVCRQPFAVGFQCPRVRHVEIHSQRVNKVDGRVEARMRENN